MTVVEAYGSSYPDVVADEIADITIRFAKDAGEKEVGKVNVMLRPKVVYICGNIHSIKLGKNVKELKKAIENCLIKRGYKKPKNIEIEFNTINYEPAENVADDLVTCYGYATNETKNRMPLIVNMAHTLEKCIEKSESISATSNGKCQIALNNNGKIERIVINHMTKNVYDFEKVINEILENEIVDFGKGSTTFKQNMEPDCKVFVNPSKHVDYEIGVSGKKGLYLYGGLYRTSSENLCNCFINDIDYTGVVYANILAHTIVDKNMADECEVRMSFVPGAQEIADLECVYCNNGAYEEINRYLKELNPTVEDARKETKNIWQNYNLAQGNLINI